MKKLLIVFTALVLLSSLLLTSCFSVDPTQKPAKTFTKSGMSVTLTEGFTETTMDGYTAAYDSSGIAVFAIREAFSLLSGLEDYTLAEYGELVISANQLSGVELKTADGLTFFEYDFENTELNTTYHYYSYVFKASDAFWMIQFACAASKVGTYETAIKTYAKSITFA